MLNEHRAFLRAIIAAPEDDLPRLIYADWLEETAGMVACEKCPPKNYLHRRSPFDGIICSTCFDKGRVSNGNAERAGFIRRQIADPTAVLHTSDGLRTYMPPGLKVKCTRGFGSEITVPTLATLFGGPCGHRGLDRRGYMTTDCPDCSGTGRFPGIAAELFAEHPVMTVRVAGLEPSGELAIGWCWLTGNGNNRRDEIPYRITKHFQKRNAAYTRFPSVEAALDALSAAIIAHGRAIAFPVEEPVLA